MKPFIYIASAYTKGDPCINARFQCKIFDDLLTDGIVLPYAPLISHFQHTLFPRDYKDWVKYDLDILPRFDAVLRLESVHPEMNYKVWDSSGADGEVKRATELGKPVFFGKPELYHWAQNIHKP